MTGIRIVPKHVRRFTAFADSIVALYARSLTVREIQGYLMETYGTEGSPQPISTVTDGVLSEVTTWQNQPLEAVYAVVFGACPRAWPEGRAAGEDPGRQCRAQQG